MKKKVKAIHLFLPIIAIILSLTMSGCFFDDFFDDSFEKYDVNQRFGDNRDGYCVKLNSSFFAVIDYGSRSDAEIYKLLNFDTVDLIGESELFYSGNVNSICYCNDRNILLKSLTNNKYILIDCNNKDNTKTFDTLEDINADLFFDFTKFNLYY